MANMGGIGGIRGKIGAGPVSFGRFTDGIHHVVLKRWDEAAARRVGSFCSFAEKVTVCLRGATTASTGSPPSRSGTSSSTSCAVLEMPFVGADLIATILETGRRR